MLFKTKYAYFLGAALLLNLLQSSPFAYGAEIEINRQSPRDPFEPGAEQRRYAENFELNSFLDENQQKELQEEEENPEWKVLKGFALKTNYVSNLFGSRLDAEDDFIVSYSPTIGVGKKVGKKYVTLFYNLSYDQYTRHEEENRLRHGISSDTSWNFEIFPFRTGKKLQIYVKDSLVPDVSLNLADAGTTSGGGRKAVVTLTNSFSLELVYPVSPRTNLSYTQGWDALIFDASTVASSPAVVTTTTDTTTPTEPIDSLNSNTYTFTPKVSYAVTPKLDVYTRYTHEIAVYQDPRLDYDSDTLAVGIAGRINSKTSLSIDLGQKSKQRSIMASIPATESFIYKAALVRRLTPKISANIYTTHDLTDSLGSFLTGLGGDETTEDIYGIKLTWKPSAYMSWGLGGSVVLREAAREQTLPDLDNPSAIYTRAKADEIYKWDLTWTYRPRHYLSFLVSYKFLNKNSSFKDFEYEDNQLSSTVRMQF